MNKHTKPTLHKIEAIFKELDYKLRYEKGSFNSGYCIVENSKVVVVNKFFDTDGRVNVLLEILMDIVDDHSKISEKSKVFFKTMLKSKDLLI